MIDGDSKACFFWNQKLKGDGWISFHPKNDDHGFIPGPIAHIQKSLLFSRGKQGVHYAVGWNELFKMIEKFGEPTGKPLVAGNTKFIDFDYDYSEVEKLRRQLSAGYPDVNVPTRKRKDPPSWTPPKRRKRQIAGKSVPESANRDASMVRCTDFCATLRKRLTAAKSVATKSAVSDNTYPQAGSDFNEHGVASKSPPGEEDTRTKTPRGEDDFRKKLPCSKVDDKAERKISEEKEVVSSSNIDPQTDNVRRVCDSEEYPTTYIEKSEQITEIYKKMPGRDQRAAKLVIGEIMESTARMDLIEILDIFAGMSYEEQTSMRTHMDLW